MVGGREAQGVCVCETEGTGLRAPAPLCAQPGVWGGWRSLTKEVTGCARSNRKECKGWGKGTWMGTTDFAWGWVGQGFALKGRVSGSGT